MSTEEITLLDLTIKGGIMMIPIFALSFIAVAIFIERLLVLKKASYITDSFMEYIKKKVITGDINGAILFCQEINSPTSRMIEKGLVRLGSPLKTIEASIENVGKIELYKLEKNISILGTISGAAPMIGFLGTVTGMIQAFISIAQEEGSISPKLLSSGIYEAMITTAAGLIVGIIAYLAYNYLTTRVQKIIYIMQYNSIDFIELLQEPKS
ncbi:MAG: MotA/TolQ/ExbB proton channel family protein [Chitinophagaceae bacterium]|nr:MotA/TolQ/ExbB proton channel family protein [Chitinophagaceae bacterium]